MSNGTQERRNVCFHDFADEDEALDYAIRNQRDRQNLTNAELMRLVELVDKRRKHGGDRRSQEFNAQDCALKNRSSEATATLTGISSRKVEQVHHTDLLVWLPPSLPGEHEVRPPSSISDGALVDVQSQTGLSDPQATAASLWSRL
jgi:hypothetical protein